LVQKGFESVRSLLPTVNSVNFLFPKTGAGWEETKPKPILPNSILFWIGIIAALGIPMEFTTPQAWKKSYGLGSDKEPARAEFKDRIMAIAYPS